jgi:hypothetical protein
MSDLPASVLDPHENKGRRSRHFWRERGERARTQCCVTSMQLIERQRDVATVEARVGSAKFSGMSP